ncbi:hypothetical protein [Vulcanisaeta souniana]|uniref:Uncharacterized protein n=1 Tax=Vulcanisaeta souniana JCM 11219 TaxID=1293586 RepID=A0ABM8BNQ5_9CREN|nr:hypothetical protein [Vulcanisaeta souniana]BDR92538.1 hypothetical protein Vsou_16310 [Vulcanisaeta souniana JCM 11219]
MVLIPSRDGFTVINSSLTSLRATLRSEDLPSLLYPITVIGC